MKAWWLGFPRFRCPHCGKMIEGIKFAGRWKLPKVKATGIRKPDVVTESVREEEGREP